MAEDVKLEILLAAKNASEEAFRDVKNQLGSLQQELVKTSRVAESSFNLQALKTRALGAAAAVFAAYKTVQQALDMAEVGSMLDHQAAAFNNLANAAGTSSKRILEDLKKASRGLISEADLIASSGKALLMSIPAREITKLMEVAAATTRMTGQTITEAFSDITLGVARQSRMILDNLGIIVDVDKANADYAKSLGKTATALTDVEKRQAFMNAVVKSGDDMIRRLGSSQSSLDGINQATAASKNLWNEVNVIVASFLDDTLSRYAPMIDKVADKLKWLRAREGERSKSDLWADIMLARRLEASGGPVLRSSAELEEEYDRRFMESQLKLKASEERKKLGSWSTPAWDSARFRAQEGTWPEMTEAEKKAAIDAREKFLREQADAAKRTMEQLAAEVSRYSEDFNLALMGQSRLDEYMTGGQNQNAILRMEQERLVRIREEAKRIYGEDGDYITRHREEIGPYEAERAKKTLDEISRQGEQTMSYWTELSEHTAAAMQNNFSNFFFDAMKGELKSLSDYANAIMDSILRAASDMAGQLATQLIFGGASVGGTAGGGGLVAWLGGLLGGGGSSTMGATQALALVRHGGGWVDGSGPHRAMPAWMVASAPRLHNGLAPDEYPAILQRGERVLSRRDASRPAANVTINVAAPGGRMDRESISQLQAGLMATLSRAYGRQR